MKILNIVLLILLVVVIIAVGGYFSAKFYLQQDGNASVHPRLAGFLGVPVPTPPAPSPTKGWSIYDNFGISFQYPNSKTWGLPQESINENSQQANFNGGNFSATIQPNFNDQSGKPESFDQVINTLIYNNKSASSEEISVGGVKAEEIIYDSPSSAPTSQQVISYNIYLPFNDKSYISLSGNSPLLSKQTFDTIISTFKIDNNTQIKTDPANGNYIYNNGDITFEYPATFGGAYAQLNMQTILARPGDGNITTSGCYLAQNAGGKANAEKTVTVNNVKFCMTTGSDVGAGQLYNSYYYTALHNGYYYVLGYVVHTPNGCDNYMGTSNYQPCLDAQKNYSTLVLKPIQSSIATFKFLN